MRANRKVETLAEPNSNVACVIAEIAKRDNGFDDWADSAVGIGNNASAF